MKKTAAFFLIVVLTSGLACSQKKEERKVGDACDQCELMFEGMPSNLSWETKLAPPNEPGDPLIISGTIFKKDGKTPAVDVILYVYHTDNTGNYSPAPGQKVAKHHGHLRGWMKTDARGRYLFMTIRPASYPNRKAPQHIHPLIKEPTTTLYWIDEFEFDDDPLLTEEHKKMSKNRGGSGIIHLTKNQKGQWEGNRNIILGLNVPNY